MRLRVARGAKLRLRAVARAHHAPLAVDVDVTYIERVAAAEVAGGVVGRLQTGARVLLHKRGVGHVAGVDAGGNKEADGHHGKCAQTKAGALVLLAAGEKLAELGAQVAARHARDVTQVGAVAVGRRGRRSRLPPAGQLLGRGLGGRRLLEGLLDLGHFGDCSRRALPGRSPLAPLSVEFDGLLGVCVLVLIHVVPRKI